MSIEDEVICFVADFTATPRNQVSLETLLVEGLGVDGDDGIELFAEFSDKFEVDFSRMDQAYFGPEGFNPFTIIFHAIAAFIGGFFGRADDTAELTVGNMVEWAKRGQWVRVEPRSQSSRK